MKQFIALLLLLFPLFSPEVLASRKTDIATLYNGDRVTGEIKNLGGGLLQMSTDAMGTVNIEWQEIANLQSEFFYEVRLSDGQRYYGSIRESEVPGQLMFSDLDGEHAFEWLQVVEIRQLEKTFLDRFDIYLSAGYAYTRASSVHQGSLNTTISYETEKGSTTLSGRTSISNSNDRATSSSRLDLDRSIWTQRVNQFRSAFANFESNDELGLDHRVGVGMGLGRLFLDTYRYRLSGTVGLQLITEQSKQEGEEQNVEAYLSSKFATWRLKTPELHIDYGLNIYPNLTDAGRIRGNSDLRLRWEIIEDLFFDITAWGSYDNRAETNTDIDYGLTTGLGWTY